MSTTRATPGWPSEHTREEAERVLGATRRAARAERTVRGRLLTIAVLVAVVVSLLLAVPGLSSVARAIRHVDPAWLILAGALELASCSSFVVLFRRFFDGVAARQARRLAWTEMGSGALLPGGGVGSLAVGGWLLHLAGMPTRRIVRSSAGLFFLTSAVNLLALIAGALLIATGLSAGHGGLLRVGLPILGGSLALLAILTVARASRSHQRGILGAPWMTQLVGGVEEAKRVAARPSWRLGGAVGYLGFDIAVLWATLHAVGYHSPIGVLLLGYIIGYLANLLPVPGGIGVLEGGIAGTLALYGAPLTEATAGVLIYHAIAFWIPSLGGLIAYRLLQLDLSPVAQAAGAHPHTSPPTHPLGGSMPTLPAPIPVKTPRPALTESPVPAGIAVAAREEPPAAARARRSLGEMRARHVEAFAGEWLRSLSHGA